MTSPTPAQFRASHGEMYQWQSVDFEVYEHLVENQQAAAPRARRDPGAVAGPRRPARGEGARKGD
ncbi:hypothetical protein LG634_23355 [Streptomyces bambusae]|uniref:hypothetical protein n=1 Tax=Streptomyces bambusae TaxID=1550616 RepID=UPI001CFDC618|nr:hypothetical protein [Streptomyces bambusae]MCB5167756.1 hypothetical protein [Streptomyces bambusae]